MRFGGDRLVRGLLLLALGASATPALAVSFQPERAECIAPSNPGGGCDVICRTSSTVLQKTQVLKTNLYVTNMPGGSGAVAIANVIARRKGDPGLIVAASSSLTFTMAMNRTPHTYDDVIPLAQVAAEYGGFFVRVDSKYKTLADVVVAMKAKPNSVTFAGGSAPGSLDHIKVAVFAKAIGVEPRKAVYVPFQGGGEAMTSLLGGHTDVAAMDISEAGPQLEAGKIRCLAVLSDKRSTKFKDVPTTIEQGVNVNVPNWRGLYMPPGTPPEAIGFWSDTIKKMTATPEWARERDKLGWEATFRTGDEFAKFVKEERVRYRALLKELGFLR